MDDLSLRGNFSSSTRQFVEDRKKITRRRYHNWGIRYKLALWAALMCQERRVDVLRMAHLLKLSAGDTVLKFHRGSLSIYKGGFYSAIGNIAPEHFLSHCAVSSQTLGGLLLLMGYSGVSSRRESEVYISVKRCIWRGTQECTVRFNQCVG